ncbi:TAXI family TRAP transporter solute-binding subunit [Halalkalicoccus tibetensis]|uniref:TAXI family TRAP transporter solute-binding subunit n=1 Tax=Halalkalicoccus tibetensis TaxID=175632 RepID=A0ABD5VA97_9EURY
MSYDRRELLAQMGGAGTIIVAGCLDDVRDAGGGGGDEGEWSLGTSSEGSSSFRIGSGYAEFIEREDISETVNLEAVVTEGTGASYRRTDSGDFEVGGSTTEALGSSIEDGVYDGEEMQNAENIRQIQGYMGFYNFVIGNREAGIETWEDLEGRSVAVSSAGAAARVPYEEVLDFGIGMDNIDAEYMAFADIPEAMRAGQIDAAVTWASNRSVPIGWFQEIDATVNWVALEFDDDLVEHVENDLEYSEYAQLDEGEVDDITEGYGEPIDTFTLTYLWVTLAERDPEVIYEMCEITDEYGEDMYEEENIMGFFTDPDDYVGNLHPDVPVHEGAYNYYQDIGIWDDYDLTAPPEAEE